MNAQLDDVAAALSAKRSGMLLSRVGYDPAEVDDLHASGIAAFNLAELSEKGASEILGSNPPNLFSPDAAWDQFWPKKATDRIALIDFYSGAVFRPLELQSFALFGLHGLLVPLPSVLPKVSLDFRWRFNAVPAFLARTSRDLENFAGELERALPRGHHILYRGQTKRYTIVRRERTLKLLYGDSPVSEPSLLTTAFRERFPYVSTERHWRAIIADIDYRLTGFQDRRWWVEDRYETVKVGIDGMIARWHRVSTMAITQHYGIPTYGLDVTESIKTAWWFATHRFNSKDGPPRYGPHSWSGIDMQQWPVIYVLRSTTGEKISDLDLPATRPERQQAIFARGGWGPHGNLCADDLVAVVVLAPEVGIAPGNTASVFPPAKEDPMYAELLKLKTRLTPEHPLFKAAGLQYVFDLAYDNE